VWEVHRSPLEGDSASREAVPKKAAENRTRRRRLRCRKKNLWDAGNTKGILFSASPRRVKKVLRAIKSAGRPTARGLELNERLGRTKKKKKQSRCLDKGEEIKGLNSLSRPSPSSGEPLGRLGRISSVYRLREEEGRLLSRKGQEEWKAAEPRGGRAAGKTEPLQLGTTGAYNNVGLNRDTMHAKRR